MRLTSRGEINARAAARLLQFITNELGFSVRAFARILDIPETTLRYFLGNSSAKDTTRRHGRGPYRGTLMPILQLHNLPPDLRELLLDVIEFETRVATRILHSHSATSIT